MTCVPSEAFYGQNKSVPTPVEWKVNAPLWEVEKFSNHRHKSQGVFCEVGWFGPHLMEISGHLQSCKVLLVKILGAYRRFACKNMIVVVVEIDVAGIILNVEYMGVDWLRRADLYLMLPSSTRWESNCNINSTVSTL